MAGKARLLSCITRPAHGKMQWWGRARRAAAPPAQASAPEGAGPPARGPRHPALWARAYTVGGTPTCRAKATLKVLAEP